MNARSGCCTKFEPKVAFRETAAELLPPKATCGGDGSDAEPASELEAEQITWEPFKHQNFQVCNTELDLNYLLAAKQMKGKKIAFYLESGWDVGVFKKHYKGRSKSYAGTSQLYFNSFKKDFYAILKPCEYGPTKR